MIQLQSRDRQILETIYEQHFLCMDHVQRYVFPDRTDRRARKRIQDLEHAGLIRREEHVLFRGRALLRLTSAGVAVVEDQRSVLIPQRKKLDGRLLVHDALVTSARFRLRELWDGTWIPESLIKAEEFPQIPDGVIVFPSGRQVAVEVENTPKGTERFRQIQERWRGADVRLVLYIATSPEMLRIVRRYLEAGPRDLPFGLVPWSELESSMPRVWTVMSELDLFSRRVL